MIMIITIIMIPYFTLPYFSIYPPPPTPPSGSPRAHSVVLPLQQEAGQSQAILTSPYFGQALVPQGS